MPTRTHDKLDLYKRHKAEYAAPKKPALVETKPARYLAIDGRGGPGDETFQAKIAGLYGMAYTAKFNSKLAGRDYVVCKLEGLYWTGDGKPGLDETPKDQWCWTLLMRVPDFITAGLLDEARRALRERGKEGDFDDVGLETIDEGRCVQMLHVGPYEHERTTIDAMTSFAGAEGLRPHGRHHEIYLSDPRRVPPEKLRTILRQPVKRAAAR